MKTCPKCRTTYSDDTLKFCLQDGTLLADQQNAETESPTVAFGEQGNFDTEKLTVELNKQNPEYKTKRDLDQVRINIPNGQESQQTKIVPTQTKPDSSKTLVAVLTTAILMILLFGVGIGAYFLFFDGNKEVAKNTNNEDDRKAVNSPTPTATKEIKKESTPEPTKTPPIEKVDEKKIREEISSVISNLKSLAESRNLNEYMDYYADKLDYYTKRNVSKSFVTNDKKRAFDKFDDIEVNISNMNISVDPSGEKATAVFDKEWLFENDDASSEGKVRSELKLTKIGGRWRVTSEKDLKIYYTE